MVKKPQTIPAKPGVYQFKDGRGRLLYIGKASNLKQRLASYFRRDIADKRIATMVDEATTLTWDVVSSDIEALIVESTYIKKLKPKYNLLMRDDKRYTYVGITNDIFPRIFTTHQPYTKYEIRDTKFIGPFTDGTALRTTLKLLRKTFPYCTCKSKHDRYCLNYHINKCVGDCCLKKQSKISNKQKAYKKTIKAIRDVLTGKRVTLIRQVAKDLKAATKKQNFEKAIELRNQLHNLERIFSNAKLISTMEDRDQGLGELKKRFRLADIPYRIEGYDISNVHGLYATGSMVVFENGKPNKNEYRKFKIRTKSSPDDTYMLKELLTRRFNHSEWALPDLMLIDGGKAQINVAMRVSPKGQPIISIAKGPKRKGDKIFATTRPTAVDFQKLPQSVKALIQHIDGEAHRFAIEYYRKLHRKSMKK